MDRPTWVVVVESKNMHVTGRMSAYYLLLIPSRSHVYASIAISWVFQAS
jgi:hypothetical protein